MPTLSHLELADKYFFSWLTYSIQDVRNLFHSDARYLIKPRNRVLHGIDEMCDYWKRNSKRQRDLVVDWAYIKESGNLITFAFTANFYDKEEMQYQYISGEIDFLIENNRILSLEETYIMQSRRA